MATVGEMILNFRAQAPDPCFTLATPAAPVLTGAAGGSLSGTIYVVVTQLTAYGETIASTEQSLVLGGNTACSVSASALPGATSARAYYSSATSAENQYIALTLSAGSFTGTITSLTAGTAGFPPPINNAFLADTDGVDASAAQVYRWLNNGLTRLALLTGGMIDTTGIAGTTLNMYYTVPGRWLNLSVVRWDGWQVSRGTPNDIFYRYNVSGIPTIAVQEVRANQTVIALWPQPSQTGNTGTLDQTITATDTSFNVLNCNSFTPNSRMMIDNEVIMFSQVPSVATSTAMSGLVRGVGGTKPAAHSNGATITELKLNLTGERYSTIYSPGDSALTLDAPPEWEVPLHLYMLAEFRQFEQDFQQAATLRQEFTQAALDLKTQVSGVIRAQQLGAPLDRRVYGIGRIIIP